jgi:hypothetical protein
MAEILLAFFKALPVLWKIYKESVDLYLKQQDNSDIKAYDKKKYERNALISAMQKQGVTDEELRSLRLALYNLNSRK